jgi:hypothetical protein
MRNDVPIQINRERAVVLVLAKIEIDYDDASNVGFSSLTEAPVALNKFRSIMGFLYGIAGIGFVLIRSDICHVLVF